MPEIMTVMVVAAIITTIIVEVFRPMVVAADAEQADTDVVQTLDASLDRIQRDIRQSDPNGIFVCSGLSADATCTAASDLTAPTGVEYLAVLTGRAGGDGTMEWDDTGRPLWTGFDVFWLADDSSGTQDLFEAFAPAQIQPGVDPVILNADVVNAVALATSTSSPQTVGRSVQSIETMVDVTHDRVALILTSASSEGQSANAAAVRGDAYARN